jgi:quinol-cytochrome oxidoreductase complex cytochrome b subunit
MGNTPRVPSKAYHANVKYRRLYPNYIEKDLVTVTFVTGIFIYFVCFNPFIFDNPVNYLPGDLSAVTAIIASIPIHFTLINFNIK